MRIGKIGKRKIKLSEKDYQILLKRFDPDYEYTECPLCKRYTNRVTKEDCTGCPAYNCITLMSLISGNVETIFERDLKIYKFLKTNFKKQRSLLEIIKENFKRG